MSSARWNLEKLYAGLVGKPILTLTENLCLMFL